MEKLTLNLTAPIAEAAETYNQACAAHADLYRQAHADYVKMSHDDRYKPEYCRQELSAACDSADAQMSEMATKLNTDLLSIVQDARRIAESKLTETSTDAAYAGRMTFALQAIQALGATITDTEASAVSVEFRHDLPVMRLFHTIIEKQLDDPKRLAVFTDPDFARVASDDRPALVEAIGSGLTGFKQTFDYQVCADRVLELLKSLQEVAEKAFTHKPAKSGDMMHLDNSSVLYLPMPALTELMRVEQLKKLAQQVETVLNFMDLCGDFQ